MGACPMTLWIWAAVSDARGPPEENTTRQLPERACQSALQFRALEEHRSGGE